MQNLYILPFDHRNNFTQAFFGDGIKTDNLTSDQIATITHAKQLIYDAFKLSIKNGLPKTETALLVDEKFGSKIIVDAVANNYITAICVEKTGQELFEFEYGTEFKEHITAFKPTIVKALIRYNPVNTDINKLQQERLRVLSDFCHYNNYTLLLEPLVNATHEQFAAVSNDRTIFDKQMRPSLTVKMIEELQNAGVEADIWKIEGLYQASDYEKVVNQAQINGRKHVIVIVLGRAESQANVELWLSEGAKVQGVNGFAVGRTVFMEDIEKYIRGELQESEVIQNISRNFIHFYNYFKQNKLKY